MKTLIQFLRPALLFMLFVSIFQSVSAQKPDEPKSPPPVKMHGDQFNANVVHPGDLRKVMPKEVARGVRRLSIRGTLNNDDIRYLNNDVLKRSTCYNDRGRSIENFVDLDLSDADFSQSVNYKHNSLKNGIFDYASHLRSIRLPRHTREIGDRAFSNCSQLEHVEMPRYVIYIGDEAFRDCHNLTDIRFPEGLQELGKRCFYGCSNLQYVQLPSTVITIGDEAFVDCPLSTLHLPSGLRTLGYCSLKGTHLREITIPQNAHIEGGMPGNNSQLERIVVERGNREYVSDKGVLYDFNGTALLLAPSGFRGHLSLPDGLEEIAPYSCMECGMSSISIPASVRKIGKGAFQSCVNLTTIAIPYNVTVIEPYSFSGCVNLQHISLTDNIRSMGEKAFNGCKNLLDLIIPKGVTLLGKEVFMECDCLYEVHIPNGITSLPFGCFRNCKGLRSVTFPSHLLSIGDEAFRGCLTLPSITLPQSLTTIGDEVFRSCEELQEIVIPRNVLKIGKKPFTKCPNLVRIICESTRPPELKSADNKSTIVIVPQGSASFYKKTSGWKKFKKIEEW